MTRFHLDVPLERETKYLLLKSHYDKLKLQLDGICESVDWAEQHNIYLYDSENSHTIDRLDHDQNRPSVRLRISYEASGSRRVLLTTKTRTLRQNTNTNVLERRELEFDLSDQFSEEAPFQQIEKKCWERLPPAAKIDISRLSGLPSNPTLEPLCKLINVRYNYKMKNKLVFELDSFQTMSGNSFQELEVETKPTEDQRMIEFAAPIFKKLAIPMVVAGRYYPSKHRIAMMDHQNTDLETRRIAYQHIEHAQLALQDSHNTALTVIGNSRRIK